MCSSYGSAKVNYLMPGARTTQTHFIAAETIGEKTDYLPTGNEIHSYAWYPVLIWAIKAPATVQQDQTYSVNYAIEWSFDVTFRGTRYQ